MSHLADLPTKASSRAASWHRGILAVQGLSLLLAWGSYATLERIGEDSSFISAALTIQFAWSLASWRLLGRRLLEPYPLFLVSMGLFQAAQSFLDTFGLLEHRILAGLVSAEAVVESLYIVLIALAALHLGAVLADVRLRVAKQLGTVADEGTVEETARGLARALVIVAGIPTVILIVEGLSIFSVSGTIGLYQQQVRANVDAAPVVIGTFLVPAALFGIATHRRRFEAFIYTGVILAFSASQMLLGVRSTALMPLAALAWLWDVRIKRLPRAAMVAAGFFVLGVLNPLVAIVRSEPTGLSGLMAAYSARFDSLLRAPIAALVEFGGTLQCLACTVILVPFERAYDLGASYAYALLTIFPNLGSGLHPTIEHGTLSDWLVWRVDPYWAAQRGGLGFSAIAEAYLNFGVSGVVFVMTLIGFALQMLVGWAERHQGHARLAVVASVLAVILRFPRDESASMVRYLVWYSFAPYALVVLIARFRAARRASTEAETPVA